VAFDFDETEYDIMLCESRRYYFKLKVKLQEGLENRIADSSGLCLLDIGVRHRNCRQGLRYARAIPCRS
jgi:hypothetical protein